MLIEIAAFSKQLHTDLNTAPLALADINDRAKKKPDLKVKKVANLLNNILKAVQRLEKVAGKILLLTNIKISKYNAAREKSNISCKGKLKDAENIRNGITVHKKENYS